MANHEKVVTTDRASVEQFVRCNLSSVRRCAVVCAVISGISIFGSIKTREPKVAAAVAAATLTSVRLTRLRVREIDHVVGAYADRVSRVSQTDPKEARRSHTVDALNAVGGTIFVSGATLASFAAERVAEGHLDSTSFGVTALAGLSVLLGTGSTSPEILKTPYGPILNEIDSNRLAAASIPSQQATA